MSYNFGCMIASDTLFDSRGGFLGSSYSMSEEWTCNKVIVKDSTLSLCLYTTSQNILIIFIHWNDEPVANKKKENLTNLTKEIHVKQY